MVIVPVIPWKNQRRCRRRVALAAIAILCVAHVALGQVVGSDPAPQSSKSVASCVASSALAGAKALVAGVLGIPSLNKKAPVAYGVLTTIACTLNQTAVGRALEAFGVLHAQVGAYNALDTLLNHERIISRGDVPGTAQPSSFVSVVPASLTTSWFNQVLTGAGMSGMFSSLFPTKPASPPTGGQTAVLSGSLYQNANVRRLFGPDSGGFAAAQTQGETDASETAVAAGVLAQSRAAMLETYADSLQSELTTQGLHSGRADQLNADIEFTRAVAAAQRLTYQAAALRSDGDAAGTIIPQSPVATVAWRTGGFAW